MDNFYGELLNHIESTSISGIENSGEDENEIFSAMNRREFIARGGAMMAGFSLMPYLFSGNISADAGEKAEVGLIRTDDRREAVQRSFELMPPPEVEGDSVLIKPNFYTADPAPGSTHNDTLTAIIDWLQKEGAGEITIGERSGPPNTEEVMREKGIFELAEEKGVEVVNFDQVSDDELIHFQQDQLNWRDGFHIPRILHDVDHIVAAGCLKTHQFGGQFTMALKLAVGIIPRVGTNYMDELHGSDRMRDLIAEINLAYDPDIYIIDGVEAFTDGGPSSGERVQADVTLVSGDPVAVDAAGVGVLKELGAKDVIMETPVFELEQIARAAEIGLGVGRPEQIRLISDNEEGKKYSRKIEKQLT